MTTWSPTSLFNHRAYGSENLRPIPQKEFCNTIPLQADMMGGVSGLPVAQRMRSSSLVPPSGRGSAAIASKTIPSLAAPATVRFVAVAMLEVPIAGRARWFARLPDGDRCSTPQI
jgi:hypothetical protein